MNTIGSNQPAGSFQEQFDQYSWQEITEQIQSKNESNVQQALTKRGKRDLNDLMSLLSPAAEPFLEEMARLSRQLTLKRFGKTIQMYIPLYLSNECTNSCLYCGFRRENKIERIILDEEAILKEVEVIKSFGFDHLLLVSGEHRSKAGVDFLERAIEIIRPHFAHISLEVQPLQREEYERFIPLGLNTVLVYQETYGSKYQEYHPKGAKSNFENRLETADRLGKAGIHKIGLGCLLGLDDWRTDSWFVGAHLNYLEKRYWKTKYSISFPRLRPAAGVMQPEVVVSDRDLLQLICAYRIFNENVELSLSTRESPIFRDHAIGLGITTISAGSSTEPGGYSDDAENLKQFETADNRSPEEVATIIRKKGYEPLWKDWDVHYCGI